MPIGYPRWPPWQPSWKSIFRLFSWTERPVDWNLVGSIGVTRRSKTAKIVPIVNRSWLPFRYCSNDHAELTGMPYIFFFKIKNCLNDDLFISCDDRIGKMLHNICISAVAMSLRWATRGPWASCLFIYLFACLFIYLFIHYISCCFRERKLSSKIVVIITIFTLCIQTDGPEQLV